MKTVEERKNDIERMFSQIGVKPVHRTKIDGNEVFIADGFVPPAMIDKGYLKKFEVKPGEFPFGCFLTVWWSEQHKGTGSIAVCDAFHDAESGYSPEDKQKMRINSALHLATRDMQRRKMH